MKENNSVRMRWLRKDEASLGMAAIRRLWRRGHILAHDEKLFLWQYGRGKDSEHLGFLIAEAEEGIVACSGTILLPYHYYGKSLHGGCGAITVVSPPYRESGLGLTLMPEADRELDIICSCGISKRIAIIFRLQGRHVFEEFPRAVCLGKEQALESYLRGAAYTPGERRLVQTSCSRLVKTPAQAGFRLEELNADNLEEWDAAWNGLFAPHLIGVARTADYLRWRYWEHPRFRYQVLLARNAQGQICGLTAWRNIELPGGISAMRILDFLPLDESAGRALASGLAQAIPEHCAYVEHSALGRRWEGLKHLGLSRQGSRLLSVHTSPPEKECCALLAAYLVNAERVGLSAKAFVESPDNYVTLADTDQDRPHIEMEE